MRNLVFAAVALAGITSPAGAVTLMLESTTADGAYTRFNYGGSFALDPGTPDSVEGMTNGSQLVIFDFKGYVDGSIVSPYAQVAATTELVSNSDLLPPGVLDDPTIVNLVFTWTDGDFAPAPGFAFMGLSASSIYSEIDATGSAFGSVGVKISNNTPLYVRGTVASPSAVPEPTTWSLLVLGFALTGLGMRSRHRRIVTA